MQLKGMVKYFNISKSKNTKFTQGRRHSVQIHALNKSGSLIINKENSVRIVQENNKNGMCREMNHPI